jgi:hypothetical protein
MYDVIIFRSLDFNQNKMIVSIEKNKKKVTNSISIVLHDEKQNKAALAILDLMSYRVVLMKFSFFLSF